MIDIVILTPLIEEWEEMAKHIDGAGKIDAWSPAVQGRIGGHSVLCQVCGKGQEEASSALTKILEDAEPSIALLVGIAGGFPALGIHRGDVVVAHTILGLEFGKLSNGKFIRRPENDYNCDRSLLEFANLVARSEKTDWQLRILQSRPDSKNPVDSRAHTDCYVASGNKVVDDPDHEFYSTVAATLDEVHAVETEAVGVGASVRLAQSEHQLSLLVVRGISDEPGLPNEGGTANRKAWRRYAAAAAAAFVRRLIEALPTKKRVPTPRSIRDGSSSLIEGNAPPVPSLVIGREVDMLWLRSKVFDSISGAGGLGPKLIVVWGLPGVGKTTLAACLANDSQILEVCADGGPLWASLGQSPDILSHLDSWSSAAGLGELRKESSLEAARERLAARLKEKKLLLVIDDVWSASHAKALNVGGRLCTTLITTRYPRLALDLVTRAEDVYPLKVLSDSDGLNLLQVLAPSVTAEFPTQSSRLVHDLEGLPLALQVAGRLVRAKVAHGYSIERLIDDLRSGAQLLEQEVPPDMADLVRQSTPKVAVLLRKSTDVLDETTRERFALLGLVKEKPATFGWDFMKAQWIVDDPSPTAEILIDRGLMEKVGAQRYRMHALLVALAYSLLEK